MATAIVVVLTQSFINVTDHSLIRSKRVLMISLSNCDVLFARKRLKLTVMTIFGFMPATIKNQFKMVQMVILTSVLKHDKRLLLFVGGKKHVLLE